MGIRDPKIILPKIWKESFFAFLVICFFAYSLKSHWLEGKKHPQAPATVENSLNKKDFRVPASISTTSEEKSTFSLVLGCLDTLPSKSFETTAALVQIQWEKCSTKEKMEAKNQTTGESLLLLENGSKIFTHYFPVKFGKNEISIESQGKKTLKSSIELIRN
jgi:hypothetical protein